MFSKIFNYAIRIIMILLGLGMVITGWLFSEKISDPTLIVVFGTIVMLFGFYRLVMYRIQSQRYQEFYLRSEDNEEEN